MFFISIVNRVKLECLFISEKSNFFQECLILSWNRYFFPETCFWADNLSWSANTSAVFKKAQQRLHFLRVLRKSNICEKLLVTFYRSTIESILTYCITVWFSHCTEADRQRLQRVVRTAEKIIGCPLPSLRHLYTSRCLSRAEAIKRDNTHPAHHLFELLPSGRRYRSIRTRTNRLRNSFFPQAITALNLKGHWHTHGNVQ